jgi:NAD(P)-dependent dehydrogenase (short-subunit alcohol dehydrogenase family)
VTDLQGLAMVITGAATGMGQATAELAAKRGARVVVADIDEKGGEEVVSVIAEAGGTAHFVGVDLAEPDSIRELMEEAAARFGGIDVVHNNAGIAEAALTSHQDVESMPVEIWDRVHQINLRAPWLAAKYALPFLKGSKNASIVNAGSVGSHVGFLHATAYGASKGGVAVLTKNLAVELAPFGIRVNCYCPGIVETGMAKRYFAAHEDPQAAVDDAVATKLVPRLGAPSDIAELACFLASPAASWVDGVVWLIDGGQLAWRGTRAAFADM